MVIPILINPMFSLSSSQGQKRTETLFPQTTEQRDAVIIRMTFCFRPIRINKILCPPLAWTADTLLFSNRYCAHSLVKWKRIKEHYQGSFHYISTLYILKTTTIPLWLHPTKFLVWSNSKTMHTVNQDSLGVNFWSEANQLIREQASRSHNCLRGLAQGKFGG